MINVSTEDHFKIQIHNYLYKVCANCNTEFLSVRNISAEMLACNHFMHFLNQVKHEGVVKIFSVSHDLPHVSAVSLVLA